MTDREIFRKGEFVVWRDPAELENKESRWWLEKLRVETKTKQVGKVFEVVSCLKAPSHTSHPQILRVRPCGNKKILSLLDECTEFSGKWFTKYIK